MWRGDDSSSENDSTVNKENWQLIYADSEDNYGSHLATHAFDNNPYTFWHTEWKDNEPAHPHEIQIDLGDTVCIYGFKYLPRQDGNVNGNIAEYQFFASNDSLNWGEPIKSGTFSNETTAQKITFSDTINCKFIRLRALSEINGKVITNVAELDLMGYYEADVPVGINNPVTIASTKIYPNPFSEEINVKIISNGSDSSWRIYSLDGQVLKQGLWLMGKNVVKINTQELKTGIYILELNTNGGREVKLIVKK